MRQATFEDMPQPLKDAFLHVNPDLQQLRIMHDKDAARMRGFADVPDETVRAVRTPTLVVMGDRDVATPEHAVSLFRLLPQARLLILPSGHGHYLGETSAGEVDGAYAELTVRLIARFLTPTKND
jgi:pimeloyl-ACP methyl ester carboxylesterase